MLPDKISYDFVSVIYVICIQIEMIALYIHYMDKSIGTPDHYTKTEFNAHHILNT